MYELTYYSLAKRGINTGDISAILQTAQTFNAKNEITGCLLYYKNQFIQILEGKKETIEQLLARIKEDARHHNLFVLAQGEKEERSFSNWTMAYRELNEQEAKDINENLFKDNFLTFSALASKPTHTIKSFWTRVQRLLTDDYTT